MLGSGLGKASCLLKFFLKIEMEIYSMCVCVCLSECVWNFKSKEGSAHPFCKIGANHLKKTLKEYLEYFLSCSEVIHIVGGVPGGGVLLPCCCQSDCCVTKQSDPK